LKGDPKSLPFMVDESLMLRFFPSFLQISHFEKTMGVPSGVNPSLGDDVNLDLKIMIYPEGKSVRVKTKL